jgi:hypothetical protein
MIAQQLSTNKTNCEKALDLDDRNVWKSDSLIIVPAHTEIINLKTNQIEIRHTKATPNRVFLQTELKNEKTFNNMRGYALFRNMKIETLYKHHHDNKEK